MHSESGVHCTNTAVLLLSFSRVVRILVSIQVVVCLFFLLHVASESNDTGTEPIIISSLKTRQPKEGYEFAFVDKSSLLRLPVWNVSSVLPDSF